MFIFLCIYLVELSPTNVTACLGDYVTFTCRTTGGALLWETTGGANVVFDDAKDMSSILGIFNLSVFGVLKDGTMVAEVNSTATTLVGVRQSDDNVMLGCRETTSFTGEQAVLRVCDGAYVHVLIKHYCSSLYA